MNHFYSDELLINIYCCSSRAMRVWWYSGIVSSSQAEWSRQAIRRDLQKGGDFVNKKTWHCYSSIIPQLTVCTYIQWLSGTGGELSKVLPGVILRINFDIFYLLLRVTIVLVASFTTREWIYKTPAYGISGNTCSWSLYSASQNNL